MDAVSDQLDPHDDAPAQEVGRTDGNTDGNTDAASVPTSLSGMPEPFDLGEGDLATRIAHAKQRHGMAGAMLAAGMLGIDQAVNGRKPREEAPIVVDAPGEPGDIDRDGIAVSVDDAGVHVAAPPLPRSTPITAPDAGSSRRSRRWGR